MNRRDMLKALGFGAAVVVPPSVVAAAEATKPDQSNEVAALKDLVEFHKAARDAEAKTYEMIMGLKDSKMPPVNDVAGDILKMVRERHEGVVVLGTDDEGDALRKALG